MMEFSSKFIVALSAILTVTGCATGLSGETVMGKAESPMWHKSASMETKIAHFEPVCRAYGHEPNTSGMANCLQSALQASRNNAQSTMDSIDNGMKANRRITCTSFGNETTCR